MWKEEINNINWDELAYLYKIAPLGEKDLKDLKTVFSNSRYVYFIYNEDKLIGAERALADGVDCAYICDVAIHPEYQAKGLGSKIISKLIEGSKGHKKILLYAVPGKEKFYARFGFKKMRTAMAIFENQEQAMQWGLISDEI